MSKLNLEQFIKLSDDVCNDISRANVANVAAERETLKETFHYELLKFAIFLADADEEIDDNEIGIIRTNLDDKITIERLEAIKKCERIDDRFSTQVPSCLKYAVLADAGRKLNPDPYKGQKAMIIYDTFRLFGQTMLSTREQEVSDVTVLRFTLYMERLDPDKTKAIINSVENEIQKLESLGKNAIIITSPIVRMYFKKLTEDYFKDLIVVSYNEVESNVELQSVGMVTA